MDDDERDSLNLELEDIFNMLMGNYKEIPMIAEVNKKEYDAIFTMFEFLCNEDIHIVKLNLPTLRTMGNFFQMTNDEFLDMTGFDLDDEGVDFD